MSEMEELCKILEDRGFEPLSTKGYYIQVYRKGNILVRMEDKQEKKE